MGTFCLSSAPILRCETLSILQAELLIIPTSLEVIFSTCLIFTKWGNGRKHLILAAEGWVYFSLALFEMLSHIIPAVRASLRIFLPIDVTLAAVSFLPILLYTFYLWLFVRDDLVQTLPNRFQRIATYIFLLFIPLIISLNEISSFVGIKHGLLNSRLGIGFRTPTSINIWSFFTSLTLALLASYQALVFCIAFYRLIKGFIDLRHIESSSASSATYLFRGMPWIVIGLKLGAIETVVGFIADGGFGMALTRRILRFISRAVIIIGIVKGLDSMEDFNMFPAKVEKKNSIRNIISNPRYSTFQRMNAPPDFRMPLSSDSSGEITPAKATELGIPLSPMLTSPRFRDLRPRQSTADLVTVIAARDNTPPVLEMHLSALEIPSFASIVENVKDRPEAKRATAIADLASQTANMSSIADRSRTHMSAPALVVDDSNVARDSRATTATTTSADSLRMLGDITSQFPPLPPLSISSLPTDPRTAVPTVDTAKGRSQDAAAVVTPSRHKPPPLVQVTTSSTSRTAMPYNSVVSPPFEREALLSSVPPPRPARSPARINNNLQVNDTARLPVAPVNVRSRFNGGSFFLESSPSISTVSRTVQSDASPTLSDVVTTGSDSNMLFSDLAQERDRESERDRDLQQATIMTAQRTRISRDSYSPNGRPESLITAYRRQRASTAQRDVLPEGEEYLFVPELDLQGRSADLRPWLGEQEPGSSSDAVLAAMWGRRDAGERTTVMIPAAAVLRNTPRAVEQFESRESMRIDGIVLPLHHRDWRPGEDDSRRRRDAATHGAPWSASVEGVATLPREASERSFFDD